jgi:hypothetical protein
VHGVWSPGGPQSRRSRAADELASRCPEEHLLQPDPVPVLRKKVVSKSLGPPRAMSSGVHVSIEWNFPT